MIINRGNMNGLFTAFNARFRTALTARQAQSRWAEIALLTQSTTSEESYDWLGAFPGLQKWIGERVIKDLTQYGYKLVNDDFEQTIGVPANRIRDDKYGVYMPLFEGLGRASAAWPDEQVFPLVKAGFTTPCYDGQYFFDTDHPVIARRRLDDDGLQHRGRRGHAVGPGGAGRHDQAVHLAAPAAGRRPDPEGPARRRQRLRPQRVRLRLARARRRGLRAVAILLRLQAGPHRGQLRGRAERADAA